jgi:hypothetical protein
MPHIIPESTGRVCVFAAPDATIFYREIVGWYAHDDIVELIPLCVSRKPGCYEATKVEKVGVPNFLGVSSIEDLEGEDEYGEYDDAHRLAFEEAAKRYIAELQAPEEPTVPSAPAKE